MQKEYNNKCPSSKRRFPSTHPNPVENTHHHSNVSRDVTMQECLSQKPQEKCSAHMTCKIASPPSASPSYIARHHHQDQPTHQPGVQAAYAVNTRSSCLSALLSSPPHRSFSLGISFGPSGMPPSPGPGGAEAAADERAGKEPPPDCGCGVPLTRAPMLGTSWDPEEDAGGAGSGFMAGPGPPAGGR